MIIVSGVRTPFVKAFGEFLKMDTIDLSDAAVAALLKRTNLDHKEIDSIVINAEANTHTEQEAIF